jgi:Adenylate and Guanylate cyclase catalytic domain/3'5'-cyclic nucleotide phosphodiesterase
MSTRYSSDIALRRRVYKVETIGDCYVAVTGLPDPRKDHALAMARFARDCLNKMQHLVNRLEVVLGPDTAELAMRFGLHSGPVTAGVLRGERSRFQLFGDTMNTASRMESTGERNKIQISLATANLLMAAGKESWLTPRDDKVVAKGKGEMQTFWLSISTSRNTPSVAESGSASCDLLHTVETGDRHSLSSQKRTRLIRWNVEILLGLLMRVVSNRTAETTEEGETTSSYLFQKNAEWEHSLLHRKDGCTILDEVQEIIHLPDFRVQTRASTVGAALSLEVEQQLKEYVTTVASFYHDNEFHCFEHASHVTMSVVKMLNRIIEPDLDSDPANCCIDNDQASQEGQIAATLHNHIYGITSDPLTQFACAFSALIHDIDHPGVPNTQLIRENKELAARYNGKSVAEQNSVDLAWNLLLDDKYTSLRGCIAPTPDEQVRFRHLVVNSVMATDVLDNDLKQLRNRRWDQAFAEGGDGAYESPKDAIDRKATIVIEHLIQASDVCHTMQHWHVYHKWNSRLFSEMYQAYASGRAEKDPSEYWYQGELDFLDLYIIPLAKKVRDCGVFGVSSSECLDYALKNRQEWESKGEIVVAEMIELEKAKPKREKAGRRDTKVLSM